MNDVYRIQDLYASLHRSGGTGVLATVVRTSGSTYRRAGARMLVSDNGRSAGLISGGCLESDLRERSKEVLSAGKPILVTYDSSSPGDILWGLGLGCTGIAHVLLERISGGEPCRALEFIEECRALRSPGAVASVYAIAGFEGETTGSRVFVRDGLPRTEGPAETTLAAALGRACADAISSRKSSQLSVTLPGGTAEAFIEYVPPPVSLFVFGAGPDAPPLVSMATELGWIVTVVDGRPAYLTQESFPSADELILAHPGDTSGAITIPREAAAVVMTHNFNNDLALVRTLLGSLLRRSSRPPCKGGPPPRTPGRGRNHARGGRDCATPLPRRARYRSRNS